jgi:hypothetical protein
MSKLLGHATMGVTEEDIEWSKVSESKKKKKAIVFCKEGRGDRISSSKY